MIGSLFNSFAEMIDSIPAKAILRAVELECKMLDEDSAYHGEESQEEREEALSIQCFYRFLQVVQQGQGVTGVNPPLSSHVAFYRKTLLRLVEAGLLPAKAVDLFDRTWPMPPARSNPSAG